MLYKNWPFMYQFVLHKISVEKIPCILKVEDNSFRSPLYIKQANIFKLCHRFKISVNSCYRAIT